MFNPLPLVRSGLDLLHLTRYSQRNKVEIKKYYISNNRLLAVLGISFKIGIMEKSQISEPNKILNIYDVLDI